MRIYCRGHQRRQRSPVESLVVATVGDTMVRGDVIVGDAVMATGGSIMASDLAKENFAM